MTEIPVSSDEAHLDDQEKPEVLEARLRAVVEIRGAQDQRESVRDDVRELS